MEMFEPRQAAPGISATGNNSIELTTASAQGVRLVVAFTKGRGTLS